MTIAASSPTGAAYLVDGDRRRVAALGNGLVRLLAGALLVVGVPWALWRGVGWPLPAGIPTLHELTTALQREYVPDGTLVKALALALWLLWVNLLRCVAVEARAWLRGTRAPHLRFTAAGRMQHLAAWLLPAVAIIWTSIVGGSHTGAEPQSLVVDRPAAITVDLASFGGDPTQAPAETVAQRAASEPAGAPASPTVLVQRFDTLWDLAERHLGDPFRWPELFELNRGAAQPDGTVFSNPDRLVPGWPLVLPADASIEPSEVVEPAPGERVVEVVGGDSFWTIAERQVAADLARPPTDAEIASYHSGLVEANRDRLVLDGDPNLIFAGQQFVLPPSLASSPAAVDAEDPVPATTDDRAPPVPPPPPAGEAQQDEPARPPIPLERSEHTDSSPTSTVTTAVPQPSKPAPPTGESAKTPVDDSPVAVARVLGIASTLLAVGLSLALRWRRRRRQLLLPPGQAVAAPPSSTEEVHHEIVLASDEDRVAWLQRVVRYVAASAAPSAGGQWIRPRVVQLGDGWVDVLLAEPSLDPPAPWRPMSSGVVWQWDRSAEFDPPPGDGDRWFPLPALVSIGDRGEDGSQLLLDLEADGLIGLIGDTGGVAALARSFAVELVHSPVRDSVAAPVLVGFDLPGADGFAPLRTVERFDEVADELLEAARSARQQLDAVQLPSLFATRASGLLAEAQPTALVLVGSSPDDERWPQLCRLAADRRGGIVLVCVGFAPPGSLVMEIDGGELRIPQIGLAARAQGLTADACKQAGDLLSSVDGPPMQLRLEDEIDGPQDMTEADSGELSANGLAALQVEGYQDPTWRVLVRFLAGAPNVVGGSRPLTDKETAVLACVVFHRGMSLAELMHAAWGGQLRADKTVYNTIDQIRDALGRDALRVAGGQVTPGADVVDDVSLFERRLLYAKHQPPDDAVVTLRGALELITGKPFTYGPRKSDRINFGWMDDESCSSRWVGTIVAAAERLASLCVEIGDLDGARWAAERGRAISAGNKYLTELLIRVLAELGEWDTAEEVVGEFTRRCDELLISKDERDAVAAVLTAARSTSREMGAA